MLYLWLKLIHVLSSTILFGTGIGTACVMVYGYRTRNVNIIAAICSYVVLADWLFTTTSGVIQPLTGFWMVNVAHYSWNSLWIWGSIAGYLVAACCWFPVVFLQIKMKNFALTAQKTNTPLPADFFRYFKYWFALGWPAFISLVLVFYFMTNKPLHW